MAIEKPTHKQIIDSIRSDVSSLLPELDPTIENTIINAIVTSLGNRIYDLVKLIEQLERNLYPDSCEGEYLEIWAYYEGLTRKAATTSTGSIVITGTISTSIPAETEFMSEDGNIYSVITTTTIANNSITISSLTRSGSIVTATTSTDHGLASNMEVTIAGADQTDYNGEYQITVTDTDEFTYTIDATPATPATTSTSLSASYYGVSTPVISTGVGLNQNLELGGKVTITTPISGIDSIAYVDYSEISGGADAETDTELLSRILQSRSNPVANFNVAAIEKVVRSIGGVTRVLVKEITPEIGDVTIYFVKDNEDYIIPTATDINEVKTALLEIKPAHTSDDSVIVSAPTPVSTNYTFSMIDPDTETMRTAIENSLEAFYEDSVTFETTIDEDAYRSAIWNTIDPETGEGLTDFTLSTPSGDITVTDGEIGLLGTISFT